MRLREQWQRRLSHVRESLQPTSNREPTTAAFNSCLVSLEFSNGLQRNCGSGALFAHSPLLDLPLSLQESLFDTHANPGLAILGFFICFAISTILWILAAFFLFILFWVTGLAIGWALRVPSYLRNSCTNFWQKWTLAPRRFRWRSLRVFSDSKTPLISEVGCSHDCQTTSKLCQECYHIIQRSRLISGSFCLFTRRVEWYKWVVPVQGSDFRTSRRSCQLCHVLWYSLDEQGRLKLAGLIRRSDSFLTRAGGYGYQYGRSRVAAFTYHSLMVTLHDLKIAVISARHWKSGKVCFRPLILVLGMLTSSEQLNGQAPSIHIPSWTGDCIELAKTWMTDCEAGHESFCSKTVLKPSKPYLPTILLYLGDKVSSELRLEETHSLEFDLLDFKYLALSYCRSENRLPMTQKLTLDKKDEWKSQINERELPLTFQHAIHLTRQLELNYLWVDVLCIVQDCPEEKKREPESMGKVFVNAHCTIASSEDANGGCFTKRNSSLLDFPCCLRFSKHNALTVWAQGQTHNLESFTKEVDEKNLSWQSWGFQERLLSRRIIHFGPKFLFFECNTHIASQGTSASQPFREKQWLWYRRKPRLHNHAF